ncbi:hypothetical protein P4641_21310 [Halalkalibacterium halodurans]|uniref:hypothetical protein n=1 Tax=Halalkalibacterium halodurans TaxID=86665 RepID=UPI002E1A507D|nr:hypothetical protein [Halalkalibacterium halodurans]
MKKLLSITVITGLLIGGTSYYVISGDNVFAGESEGTSQVESNKKNEAQGEEVSAYDAYRPEGVPEGELPGIFVDPNEEYVPLESEPIAYEELDKLFPDEVFDEYFSFKEGQEIQVKETVLWKTVYLHEDIDENNPVNDQDWQELGEAIDYLLESGFSDSNNLKDMANAKKMYELADNGDSVAFKYLQCIFSDIDSKLNDIHNREIYDVTHTFAELAEDTDALNEMLEFLERS